jgi:elongation factor Ts
MSAISAKLVKELRERTGLGMMECKKALVETQGNIEEAIEALRKSGQAKAAKKAGRIAAEGVVVTRIADAGDFGAILEVNCETDFVARDENFQAFVNKVMDAVMAARSGDLVAVMSAELEEARNALIQKIGENISVRRADVVEGDTIAAYVHGNNKVGALVALKGANSDTGRDVAMHVTASNPIVVRAEDMPESVVAKEREIFAAQAADSGKPANIIEKMVEGRVKKFLAENTLLMQPFVKDPDLTVEKYVKTAGGEVVSFVRVEVGEGIEKEEVDFAAEVAAQAGLNK